MLVLFLLAIASTAYGRSSRIINGETVTEGTYPHQVSLLGQNGNHICGGAVIAKDWVLTAAHCVEGRARQYQVVVNEHNITSSGDGVAYDVERIILHEKYGKGSGAFPNDIALLKLSNANLPASNIIQLADSGDFAGQTAIISGWGVTENGSLSSILKHTNGLILTNQECQTKWDSNINDGHICIDNQNTGACNGDSGGPMIVGKSGNYVLIGVTSWGRNGCDTTYPSVYTRVTYFRSWIKTETGL